MGVMQHYQISFYADYISDFNPSTELTHDYQDDGDDIRELCWDDTQIPNLYTPINTLEVLRNKRLIIILWYMDELTGVQKVVGQFNGPLMLLATNAGSSFDRNDISEQHKPSFMNVFEMNLTNANKVVGKIDFKMQYEIKNTKIDHLQRTKNIQKKNKSAGSS